MYTQGMTGNIVYDDGTAYVNHNAINMGDKDLAQWIDGIVHDHDAGKRRYCAQWHQ